MKGEASMVTTLGDYGAFCGDCGKSHLKCACGTIPVVLQPHESILFRKDIKAIRDAVELATDDQLRAELQRRHPDRVYAPIGSTVSLADFGDDAVRQECERRGVMLERNPLAWADMARERDEWKRRAEAAERDSANWRALAEQYRPLDRDHERGPGIAALKPDTAKWGPSDEDLLCDDVGTT